MKMIELFEYVESKIYGGWIDESGVFHEVGVEEHSEFVKQHKDDFDVNIEKFFPVADAGFIKDWIRIVYLHRKHSFVGIQGKRKSLKKYKNIIWERIEGANEVKIDIVNDHYRKDGDWGFVFDIIDTKWFYLPKDRVEIKKMLAGTSV